MFGSLSLRNPLERPAREQEFDPETTRRFSEMPDVECHDCIRLPVNRGFQNHLIIAQIGSLLAVYCPRHTRAGAPRKAA
jgi:hypothetical protein